MNTSIWTSGDFFQGAITADAAENLDCHKRKQRLEGPPKVYILIFDNWTILISDFVFLVVDAAENRDFHNRKQRLEGPLSLFFNF